MRLSKLIFENISNSSSDINFKYEHFQKTFLDLLNKHAALKPKSKRLKKQQCKPWITKGILNSIQRKIHFLKNL